MTEFFQKLFSSDSFMPHGHCFLWMPSILWLHVVSDAIITLSYASIPFVLIYIMRRRKDLAYKWVFLMFGIFIMACGTTHFMNIWTIWNPVYRLDGILKAITAVASLATGIALWPLIPKILSLPSPAQLEEKNRALIEAEKIKSRFIANVSHELRTPLTLILAPIESLLAKQVKENEKLSERQQRGLKTIHNNAIRLLQMVNTLLDFSKLEAKKIEIHREPVNLADLTQSILEDFKPSFLAKNLKYSFELTNFPGFMNMDRYLYERILFNLLSNAVKFTPVDGKIEVALSYENHHIVMKVRDSGIGISESSQKFLFEKFRQIDNSAARRYEGTGLGLTLVKEFAELLDGQVRVQSAVGQGSTFTVTLSAPLSSREAAQKVVPEFRPLTVSKYQNPFSQLTQEESALAETRGLWKILVAEDNIELAEYIRSLLKDVAQVKIAQDGTEAMKLAYQWKPDMVLSDIMMPGTDGLSLCRTLKADPSKSTMPIVLLTALTHHEALIEGWEAGADEYLFKPFHPTELLTRVRSILRSVDNRKKNEERLIQMTRLRAEKEAADNHVQELRRLNKIKDEFLATISHELRTPMNAVIGWSQLILDQQLAEDEKHEAVEVIYKSAQAQMKLIDDLLDISRIVTGKMKLNVKPVRLETLIQETVESMALMAQSRNIQIFSDMESQIGPTAGDPDRLRQVIWNLLSNAIKFSNPGGRVFIRLYKTNSKVNLEVRDEGQGIDPEFLPHVFERFLQEDNSNTRRVNGLGLGLSIVRNIIELHGGEVHVQSDGRGKGSTFMVTLSVTTPLREVSDLGDGYNSRENLENETKILSGLKILIVDDEPYARQLVKKILSKNGANVIDTSSASEALNGVRTENPDLIVSDIAMPEENGYEFIRKVRTLEPDMGHHIPSAALSAYVTKEDKERALSAGFEVHIGKPVEPHELVLKVAKLAGREVHN